MAQDPGERARSICSVPGPCNPTDTIDSGGLRRIGEALGAP